MRQLVSRQQIVDELGATPEVIRRIERLGLILPLARDAAGDAVYYDLGARHTASRVLTLVAAGYAEADIALVVGRVATDPSAPHKRPQRLITLAELARRIGVPVARIRGWIDVGALTPWAIDAIGDALFEREAEPLARALGALAVIGLDALVPLVGRSLTAPSGPEAATLHAELTTHLEQAAAAITALRALARRLMPKRRRRLLRRRKAPTVRATVRAP